MYTEEVAHPVPTRLLAERKIDTLQSLHKALDVLHSSPHSVPHVAISSIPLPRRLVESLGLPPPPSAYTTLLPSEGPVEQLKTWGYPNLEQDPGLKQKLTDGIRDTIQGEEPMVLACFASTKTGDSETLQTYGFALPTVEGYFSGVGDLFSALVLAFFKKEANEPEGEKQTGDELPPFATAVSKALLGVQQILLKTHLHTLQVANESKKREQTRDADSSSVPEEEDCVPSDAELDSLPPTPVSKGALPIPARTARRMRMRELRIIQERSLLLKLADDEGTGWPAKLLDWSDLLQEAKVEI
jgi:pyridoxine kinase